ncbi:hypothetical protein KGM_207579 [Danaus plexippus plexippus]|uniref:Uncharacterized protein n=1 Tax=Danaus plexippus plexippus TaxID=278856 RepID=A0A212FB42_DANPL|nr:hypothetical protein KGM_207579 [Danaus plexippus plexippus]
MQGVTGGGAAMPMDVGAVETAVGSRRKASRRTRTQAAAGTACRRPPGGLSDVSYDRINGRPPSFRRQLAAESSKPSPAGSNFTGLARVLREWRRAQSTSRQAGVWRWTERRGRCARRAEGVGAGLPDSPGRLRRACSASDRSATRALS